MAGALAVLALCALAAFYGGSENKEHEKRSMGIAVIASVVGAISVLIAFPSILSIGGPVITFWVPLVVGLIGIIVCLMANKANDFTGPVLLAGVTLIAWAAFRYLPTGPVAFQFLGEHVTNAGKELWTGISGWWERLTSSGPLSDKK